MKYRQTPDGQTVGFPDEMSDEDILGVFRKKYGFQDNQQQQQQQAAPEQPQGSPSILEQLGNMAGKFNTGVEASRLPAAAGGLLQGTGDMAASLGNLALKPINKGLGTDIKIPHPDLGKYVPNDILSKAAFGGGQIAPLFIPGLGLTGAAGKIGELGGITQNVAKIPGVGKTLASMLSGGATGYALGEDKQGGRGIGTVVGATLGPAVGIAGKMGIPAVLKSLFDKAVPRDLARVIQGRHDVLEKEASGLFSHVENEAGKRGINKIPVPDGLIEEANRFMPKTDASKKLIADAQKGDYSAIRDLQSDLRSRGENFKGSTLIAEQHKGEEALDLRDKINKQIALHFEKTGNKDLADTLKDAMGKYRNLKDLYFGHNVIAKMVTKGLRKVPKNIASALSEDSDPMRAIIEAHPELESLLTRLQNKKEAAKMLKLTAVPLATGAVGGAVGGHYGTKLINKLLGQEG